MKSDIVSAIGKAAEREHETRPVINRMNMGRLYTFNILASAVVLLMTAVFAVFKVHFLPSAYQTKALLLTVVFMMLSALTVLSITKMRRTELFRPAMLTYLGLISVVLYNFAFRATSETVSIICFGAAMFLIGLLPILSLSTFSCLFLAELIPLLILFVVKGISSQSIISVCTLCIVSFLLSYQTYSTAIRKLNYQISLDNALSESETDPMTKLLNRRGLDRKLADVWPMCERHRCGVAVLMLDIDNFKRYNDTFGHPQGDECLKEVTAVIRKCVRRRTDYAARVGGEEFLVLLTAIEPKEAIRWSLELRRAVAEAAIPHAPGNFKPIVSLSMGIACGMVDEALTFEELKAEADKSLYDAKKNGKDVLYYHHKAFGRGTPSARKAGNE